jgi:hypothetical protein
VTWASESKPLGIEVRTDKKEQGQGEKQGYEEDFGWDDPL